MTPEAWNELTKMIWGIIVWVGFALLFGFVLLVIRALVGAVVS